MQLHVINSNSAGNAYILESSTGEALLIECGVNFDKIKKALGFNLSRVAGCIVTHEHGDHAKSVHDVLKAGINVWATAGTHNAMGTGNHHRAKVAGYLYTFNIGSFQIIPYETKHDCAEPCCYLIRHAECGIVLFLTDSYYCEYKFKGLNNIIIEANYSQAIIDRKLKDDKKFLRDRVIESHMSIDTCCKTLGSYDLSAVQNIVLIHLSDGNSNESEFKTKVQQQTGKAVFIAGPGLTIPFNKMPVLRKQ